MDLGVWKEQVDKKMKNIATAFRRVKDRNMALASAEQLPAEDFTVCDVLAEQMRAVGQKSNQALRELLQNQVLVRRSVALVSLYTCRGCYILFNVCWLQANTGQQSLCLLVG